MAAPTSVVLDGPEESVGLRRPRTGAATAFARAYARDRQALVGAAIALLFVALAALAPIVSPHDPLKAEGSERLAPPLTPGFLLGTDEQGRDILSRIIWGGRVSLAVGILPTAVAGALALLLGLMAGYHEGWLDQVIMR